MKPYAPYLLFGALLPGLVLLLALLAFKTQSPNPIDKEYMTLIAQSDGKGRQLRLHISVNGEGYVLESLKGKINEAQGDFDMNPCLRILTEYQRGGWRIVSSNMLPQSEGESQYLYYYYFLEREPPGFKK
ncbi:MAG: hypothetical protein OHK0053_34670 [Microscillaceae bacterium]